jgi:hypothetical protein
MTAIDRSSQQPRQHRECRVPSSRQINAKLNILEIFRWLGAWERRSHRDECVALCCVVRLLLMRPPGLTAHRTRSQGCGEWCEGR